MFNKVLEISPWVMSLFFIDDLRFIALGSSVKEVVKALENFVKVIIKLGEQNTVTYNISKKKAVFFSKS